MFIGVSSHRNAKRVHSYATAQAALEAASKTPTGRNRSAKEYGFPMGGHSKSVTWVRQDDDGAINFRLYDTDVVIWYPDDSFDVDNFGTVTTTQFAARFVPAGIHLRHPVTKMGREGGHKTISFRTSPDKPWWDSHVCAGGVARFLPQGDDIWLPDESILPTMKFPELDRKGCRDVAKRYHLRDFEMWLSVVPAVLAAGGNRIEHDCWSVEDCAEALEKRDFMLASTFLPTSDNKNASFGRDLREYAVPIATRSWREVVTMGSLRKLKLALWDHEGLMDVIEAKTMSQGEFDRRMTRVREMVKLGAAYDGEYGPPA